jgi:hypothetical protein
MFVYFYYYINVENVGNFLQLVHSENVQPKIDNDFKLLTVDTYIDVFDIWDIRKSKNKMTLPPDTCSLNSFHSASWRSRKAARRTDFSLLFNFGHIRLW